MALWLFVKALAKHWWALMSCAVFTGIGVVAACLGKSNSWVVWASCIAGAFLFVVASFQAWNEEHSGRTMAEAQLLDRRPGGPEVVLSWGYPPGEDELQPNTEWDKKLLLENRGESDAYNLKTSLYAGSQITATFEPVRELKRGEKQRLDVH